MYRSTHLFVRRLKAMMGVVESQIFVGDPHRNTEQVRCGRPYREVPLATIHTHVT
jgi:hypothetical protein